MHAMPPNATRTAEEKDNNGIRRQSAAAHDAAAQLLHQAQGPEQGHAWTLEDRARLVLECFWTGTALDWTELDWTGRG